MSGTMPRLLSKLCLVTGAAQNIGRAIAEQFVAEGAAVVCVDRNEPELLAVCEGIRKTGGTAIPQVVDLAQAEAVEQMVREAAEHLGGLDVVVNNAYAGPYRNLLEQDNAGWEQALAVGLTAPMIACRTAIPYLRQRGGGSLINLGSINSFKPSNHMAAYAAVKGGIVNLTRQIAVSYGPDGVRCNAICPGYITQDQREAMFREKPLERERVLSTIPLRRLGTGADIAHAAVYLASDESRFLTGQALIVDGGSTAQNANVPTHYFEQAVRNASGAGASG